MNERVTLYDREALARIDRPDTADGRYARAYLAPMMEEGAETPVCRFRGAGAVRVFPLQRPASA